MIVLGVESSCDETAVAIVEDGKTVLSSLVSSQANIHSQYGGVIPEIAAREHLEMITPLTRQCFNESGYRVQDIDLIAVTQGPGLLGSLLVGHSFARGLAMGLDMPLIPVDHVHSHVHGAFLGLETVMDHVFPCLALVVSGGHTILFYMRGPIDFELIATTQDDACGECFDKVAKLLGFNYPGGPIIEKIARNGNPKNFPMPKMVAPRGKLMFSYSGLKTHVAYQLQRNGLPNGQQLADFCAAFQEEALGQLVRKVETAIRSIKNPIKSIIIAGGVAANIRFREMLANRIELEAFFPEQTYCSDNAAMVAALGWHKYTSLSESEKKTS